VPCLLSIAIGLRFLEWMSASNGAIQPFSDAVTYLAAGERLAAGHDLYRLTPDDRRVLHLDGISDAPLISPPPIAVLWRVIVAIPFGFQAWIAACWVALLGTTYVLVRQSGLTGAILATALSPGIGEQLAACNMAAFFPGLLALAWVARSSRASGAIVGVLAALKLSPGTLAGWILGDRRRGFTTMVAALVASALVSYVAASADAIPEYIGIVSRGIGPSWLSLSGLTGIPWLSFAVLAVGTMLAFMLGKWPAASFSVAVLAAVLGTPALYLSGLVTLLALLAPIAWPVATLELVVETTRTTLGPIGLPSRFALARVPWRPRR